MNGTLDPAQRGALGASSGGRGLATATLVVLAAVGLSAAGFVADASQDARVPTGAALDAAVEVVRGGYREGDEVAVRPGWFGDVLWHALTRPEGPGRPLPAAALQRGDRLDPLELLRGKRLWVVAAFDHPAQPAAPWLDPLATLEAHALGAGVSVAALALPEMDLRRRLTEDVARLRVARQAPDAKRPKPCRWSGREHQCAPQTWLNPRVERVDVYHRDVDWLFAVPGPGSTALIIDWPIPAGEALVVRAGFSLTGVRTEGGSDVRVSVSVAGAVVDEFVLPPHRYIEARRLVPVTATAGGRPADVVRFVVQATDHNFRHLMLQADVLGAVPEAVRRWIDEAPPL
jgi:hypothetical protein